MDVRIQSIHFDASEQLQAFIQKKVSKLEKYYEDIKKVEVSLKVVKPEVAENKEAGGQRWIRTTEGVSQQIYSLPHLATLVFALFKIKK